MRVAIPRESAPERRVAATPDTVIRLVAAGFEVAIQAGAGESAGWDDASYAAAGASIHPEILGIADLVVKVRAPTDEQIAAMKPGTVLIALLWPLQDAALVRRLAEAGITAIALDRIPRISRAQKMDVLSSMANISGYRAVIEAATHYPRFFTGQITAAGKTPPARVLVIGAGVAGLAAVGAARGLGADVWAFDTRAAAREQVQSLGARFLEVPVDEAGEGGGGYGKEMSQAFIDAEMALFREHAPKTDIVITTALIPGRPAPKLWLADMVARMKPGSVVVDLAASQGGNCELTVPDDVVVLHGVTLVGWTDLTGRMASDASQFFARNVVHLLTEMGGGTDFRVDPDNEIVRGALVTRGGEVLPPAPPPAAPAPIVKASAPALPAHPPRGSSPGLQAVGAVAVAVLAAMIGAFAPPEFVQHLTVFVLACFVGWQIVWSVTPALHTPLMSVTNAISGIILVGGVLQAGTGDLDLAAGLGAFAIVLAAVNVAGGFLVTQRMLAMFRRA